MANANNYGGKRLGAGRKRRPLEERILNGSEVLPEEQLANELRIPDISVTIDADEMPPALEYLTMPTKFCEDNPAMAIYEREWKWLKERDCHLLVPPDRLRYYVDRNAKSSDPIDIIINNAMDTAGKTAKQNSFSEDTDNE